MLAASRVRAISRYLSRLGERYSDSDNGLFMSTITSTARLKGFSLRRIIWRSAATVNFADINSRATPVFVKSSTKHKHTNSCCNYNHSRRNELAKTPRNNRSHCRLLSNCDCHCSSRGSLATLCAVGNNNCHCDRKIIGSSHSSHTSVRFYSSDYHYTYNYHHQDKIEHCSSPRGNNDKVLRILAQQKREFDFSDSDSDESERERETGTGSGIRRTKTKRPIIGGDLDIMTTQQPLTVCVEGNIGSGKTPFLKHFKSNPEVCVFDEPISKWRDCRGYNLLDLMYKDPQKWSLCFQSYVQLTMLDLHTKPVVQPIKMMERSIYSAHYCFLNNLRDEGLMEEAQYTVLSEWFNFSTANLPIKLDLIVYLRTDPEVAYKRIAQRGRYEENSIKLEYLQSVYELHENWLVHNQKLLPCPVLTIDANLDLEDMAPNYLLCEERMFQKSAVANC